MKNIYHILPLAVEPELAASKEERAQNFTLTNSLSLQQYDTKSADRNTVLENSCVETISLDKFSYHHDFENDIEGCIRLVEFQKNVDNKNLEDNHDIELTKKETYSDNRVEILSDNSQDSDAESVAKSISSSTGEKYDCENDDYGSSKLFNKADINKTENNVILVDTYSTKCEESTLDTNIKDANYHLTAETYDSNSESSHSIELEIPGTPLAIKDVDQDLISAKKRRSYSSDSSNSDIIVINRSKYNYDEAEKDNSSDKSEASKPLEIETLNADFDDWPPDVLIVDEDTHVLPIDETKSEEVDKELTPGSIESSHSHSSSESTKVLDDPFQRYLLLFGI